MNLAPSTVAGHEATVRARATWPGLLVGAAAGAVTGAVGTLALCRMPSDVGRNTTAECAAPMLAGAVLIGSAGAAVGALIGAGIPRRRPPGSELSFWQRASGSMGTLSAGLGAASILDGAEGGTSVATQLGYYVNFGRFVSVGPEFGYSRFGSALIRFPRDSFRIDRMSWRLGGAVRINGPFLADLRPYVLAGLGIYGWRWESTSTNESLGGNAGLGVEWMMGGFPRSR